MDGHQECLLTSLLKYYVAWYYVFLTCFLCAETTTCAVFGPIGSTLSCVRGMSGEDYLGASWFGSVSGAEC